MSNLTNRNFFISSFLFFLIIVVLASSIIVNSSENNLIIKTNNNEILSRDEIYANEITQLFSSFEQEMNRLVYNNHQQQDNSIMIDNHTKNKIKSTNSMSCVKVLEPISNCYGYIPYNVSYIIANTLEVYESILNTNIFNFVEKTKLMYGGISTNCENTAKNLFCSRMFRNCLENTKSGKVNQWKACLYLCRNLYFQCIPDETVAENSANLFCGRRELPNYDYENRPNCNDVFYDRDFYIYLWISLGIGIPVFLIGGFVFILFISLILCSERMLKSKKRLGEFTEEEGQRIIINDNNVNDNNNNNLDNNNNKEVIINSSSVNNE